jgi:hypothetical protein
MKNQSVLPDYVSDVWKDIDDLLRVDGAAGESSLELWMRILSIFQNKADVFGVLREDIGIPITDADQLYIQNISKEHKAGNQDL